MNRRSPPLTTEARSGRMAARLDQLIGPETSLDGDASAGIVITGITADSRKVVPGMLFAAMPGNKADGTSFVPDAIARGAAAVLLPEDVELPASSSVPVLRAAEPRLALARIAARYFGPGPDTIVAVTGTSGKTSVAEFTRQIFSHLGLEAASLGTLGVVSPSGAAYGSLTTPDPITLAETLSRLRAEGVTHVAMEASSHGLDQRRLDGVALSAGAFTNLGRDHLDYHPTVDDYLAAKLGLFERLLEPGLPAVLNTDGARWTDVARAAAKRGLPIIHTGSHVPGGADGIRLLSVVREGFRQRLTLQLHATQVSVELPLLGAYQVENALVAAGLAIAVGAPERSIGPALEALKGVPGRLEVVGHSRGGLAVVDYAHKPEALAACLDALRPFASGKLICVMGCGGDRDRGKRPIMGRIAVEKADAVIVTDDNPRTEEPSAIRAEIMAAATGAREIGDRADAIRAAVEMMAEGDVVVVAGKGHEKGQIVGETVLPFSDHEVLATALAGLDRTPAPLWTIDDAIEATGAVSDGIETGPVTGVSIDTRTIARGDLFVALKDVRDGHEFVNAAFRAGASAALVSDAYTRRPGDGLLLRVADPLAALGALGEAARERLPSEARIVAVTGSAGKTTTKEMLRTCLSAVGPTHASEKSYNNHWGVPLTLARMPRDTRFGVFEIGMNHLGEITPLSGMVRPHVAVITTVAPAHLGNFDSIEQIAEAKAEIFSGLEPGGAVVIPSDNPHFALLRKRALETVRHPDIRDFGEHPQTQFLRLERVDLRTDGSSADILWQGQGRDSLEIGLAGRHNLLNAAAALAAASALGVHEDKRLRAALKAFSGDTAAPMAGRGQVLELNGVLLIDESYNANPASMRAAIETMALQPRSRRRIAVLGDMLELGANAPALHATLAEDIERHGIDLVLASGPNMSHLMERLPQSKRAGWAESSAGIEGLLLDVVTAGDVVMIKGSNGSRMAPLVAALKARHGRAPSGG